MTDADPVLCAWCCAHTQCAYDDDATDALLDCVGRLLPHMPPQAIALFALERRVCFTLDGLRPRAPAAEHFQKGLREREARGEWCVERLPLGCVPQRFEDYERGEALDLWRVSLARSLSPSKAEALDPSGGSQVEVVRPVSSERKP